MLQPRWCTPDWLSPHLLFAGHEPAPSWYQQSSACCGCTSHGQGQLSSSSVGKPVLSIKIFSLTRFSYMCKCLCAALCQSFLLGFLHCTSRPTSTSAPFCYALATCLISHYMTQDDTTSCGLFSQTVLKLFIQFSKFGGFCLAYCAVFPWSIFKACSPLSCSLMPLFLFLFNSEI